MFLPTFLQLHREELQFLHPLLQLVLCGGGHRIHLLVTPVVVLIGVCVEHLEREAQGAHKIKYSSWFPF